MIQEDSIMLPISQKKVAKDMGIFYNPVMKQNRDVCLEVLSHFIPTRTNFTAALPLAGTGVRAMRIKKKFSKVKVLANDVSPTAVAFMKKAAQKNKVSFKISNKLADVFLLENKSVDYIDIDPFGSPAPFLDAAFKRIKNGGMLAITATDIAALTGTSPRAALQKYGLVVEKISWYHEFGLRALVAYCMQQACKYELCLQPVFCYNHQHFYRLYFICKRSKVASVKQLDQFRFVRYTTASTWKITKNKNDLGPIYGGPLQKAPYAPQKYIAADSAGAFGLAQISAEYKKNITKLSKLTIPYVVSCFDREHIKTNVSRKKMLQALIPVLGDNQ